MPFSMVLIAFSLAALGVAIFKNELSFLRQFFSSNPSKEIVRDLLAQADIQVNGLRPWDIQVHDEAFYSRVMRDGSLGIGEAYIEGAWDCEALDECFYRMLRAKLDRKVELSWDVLWAAMKARLLNMQTKTRSLEVIDKHYQIGNDLYERMLDASLTYSCGYWKEAKNLGEAQQAKYDLICRKLYLQPGMRVLDIGCGWGGFAKFAAENYGAQVVGVTLSSHQADHARQVTKGLPVDIRLQDYREVNESFDRVIEIGMFEHVGAKNYREFMDVVDRCLKDEGLFVLHTIGSNVTWLGTDPWIDKYIFPNGHLPSPTQVGQAVEDLFVIEDWHNFGVYYDQTLLAWFENFNHHWHEISQEYGTTFYRMWKYYLLSCAGSFRARSIQLWQVVLSKGGVVGGYVSVR